MTEEDSTSSTMIYKLVSSAKSRILELMSLTISLIYIKKRRGPKIELEGLLHLYRTIGKIRSRRQHVVFAERDKKKTTEEGRH